MPSILAPQHRWILPSPAVDPPCLSAAGLHPLVAEVLARRGLGDVESALAFLSRDPGADDPYGLADMYLAVERLRSAIRKSEPIAIYGDFDVDGVAGVAILGETLRSLGATVRTFIPHRRRHGYGLHTAVLQALARQGCRVVVTVDCGVRDVEALRAAGEAGLDVIVTDHHRVPDPPPEVLAILNPHRPDCRYGFTDLSGSGVAYKLAQALLEQAPTVARPGSVPLAAPALLDLVALGTVGDVVPLLGENRSLVHRGLEWIRRRERIGLAVLMDIANLRPEAVSARSLAFGLIPRLNAAGRMADPALALELLTTAERPRALELARYLDTLNEERRAVTSRAVSVAAALIEAQPVDDLIWHATDDVPLGVLGLVAGRLAERYHRPAVVVRIAGDVARGSARSVPVLDITALLETTADLLIRYGGHRQAAGFDAATRHLPELRQRLTEATRRALGDRDRRPPLLIDAHLSLEDVDLTALDALEALSPFGEANPQPRFLVREAGIEEVRVVGGQHLRLRLVDAAAGSVSAIAFGQGDRLAEVCRARRIDLVAHLRRDDWGGRTEAVLEVLDMAVPGTYALT